MLELSDNNVRAFIIKLLQQEIMHVLEANEMKKKKNRKSLQRNRKSPQRIRRNGTV